MPKKCDVPGCGREIPQRMLMCGRHWKQVAFAIQNEVWRAAKKMWAGGDPADWIAAADKARAAVLERAR